MAEDPQNLVIPGNFHLYTAPVGTTLPTVGPSLSDPGLDPAFKLSGYTTPDGTSFVENPTFEGVRVHQSKQPVRMMETDRSTQFITTFREFNTETFRRALGGATVTVAGGVATLAPATAGTVAEFAAVADFFDGAKYARWVFPRLFTASGINMPLSQQAPADLPSTFEVLEPGGGVLPWKLITNIDGLVSNPLASA